MQSQSHETSSLICRRSIPMAIAIVMLPIWSMALAANTVAKPKLFVSFGSGEGNYRGSPIVYNINRPGKGSKRRGR